MNWIAFGLEVSSGPWRSAGGLRPEGKGMVYILFVKAGFYHEFRSDISCELMNDGPHHLLMGHFFCSQKTTDNVPLTAFVTGMIFIISIGILYDFTCFYFLRMPVAALRNGFTVYDCECNPTLDGNLIGFQLEDAKA